MKTHFSKSSLFLFLVCVLLAPVLFSCGGTHGTKKHVYSLQDTLHTHTDKEGLTLKISIEKGSAYKYPLLAVWLQDTNGKYIQTLYVAESIAKGYFRYGDPSEGFWKPGEVRRPAALPYWSHQRGIKAKDGFFIPTASDPMSDAYTGATPRSHALLFSTVYAFLEDTIYDVLLEINEPFDWNMYWNNGRFPDEPDYLVSAQPAVVYQARINLHSTEASILNPIGHSHYAGNDGSLTTNLSTLTSALKIINQASVSVQTTPSR